MHRPYNSILRRYLLLPHANQTLPHLRAPCLLLPLNPPPPRTSAMHLASFPPAS
jgi:hypothetical protein